MVSGGRVFWFGMAQLIGWGISYYLIGVFGEAMAADLGHGMSVVHGGFSLALMVMGVASGPAGRLIDRFGGRPMLVAGAVLTAIGCAGLALAHGLVLHYAAWACLGLAMRLSLYDAAFAALARLLGPAARKPIAQITLLGGLPRPCSGRSAMGWPTHSAGGARSGAMRALRWPPSRCIWRCRRAAGIRYRRQMTRQPQPPAGTARWRPFCSSSP
ncbi:MAG: MFS transporter [Ferrovibrionaceae bacterium]